MSELVIDASVANDGGFLIHLAVNHFLPKNIGAFGNQQIRCHQPWPIEQTDSLIT